jgi:hypothetical protein
LNQKYGFFTLTLDVHAHLCNKSEGKSAQAMNEAVAALLAV